MTLVFELKPSTWLFLIWRLLFGSVDAGVYLSYWQMLLRFVCSFEAMSDGHWWLAMCHSWIHCSVQPQNLCLVSRNYSLFIWAVLLKLPNNEIWVIHKLRLCLLNSIPTPLGSHIKEPTVSWITDILTKPYSPLLNWTLAESVELWIGKRREIFLVSAISHTCRSNNTLTHSNLLLLW